jgi:serine/threonine-protein kinase
MPETAADPLFLSFQLALAGRYSIDRELGRGGMGIVYLAREVHLDRLVAIKLLPPDRAADGSLREGFLREARLAAKLSHPNIIPIHAVDDVGGFVFYVMAYVDGETLAHRVRTRGPFASSEGARVLREVAWALAHAHGQGLVHRDVKPDNVLLEQTTGRVLVADFGIAAATGDRTGDGVTGTPEFMSPEQALGRETDARSDLYGLGVTAFYVFSGRLPFEGKSATEVLAKQVTEPAPQLAAMGLSVSRKLALLVDRCLAKEPNHRPASAEALAEQLGLALEQRREVPAVLRAFVKRNGRIDGGGTLLFQIPLLVGSIMLAMVSGAGAGFGAFGFGITVVPFAYLVFCARRFLKLGFTHQDLGPAFKSEIEQALEERALGQARGPKFVERTLRITMLCSGAMFGLTIPLVALTIGGVLRGTTASWIGTVFGLLGGVSGLSTLGYVMLLQRRRDIDTDFWSKVWLGRIGKSAFAVAKKLLGKRARVSAMTHRATELSLGMAAENLYETLPKTTRQALGDLPGLLRRLQEDAQSLRKRYDDLQEAFSAAGDAGSTDAYSDLRAARDNVHAKLGDAVGALETIRLNLLRLHAGSGTVESFTTHIGLAAEVSAEVERLLAAQGEVERALAFPRDPVPTPG